jgi:predicted Rdx family selenoprotein
MTSIEITIEYCGHCGFGRTALAIQAIIQSSFGEQFEIYLTSTPRRTGLICIRYGKEDDGRILWKNNRKETEAKKDEIVAQVRNLLPAEAEIPSSNSGED